MDFQVFYAGDTTGSTFFRIPFLITTQKGTLLAGTDVNFGSTGDSAENIDVAIRRKPNAKDFTIETGWEKAFIPEVLHMKDYTDERIHQDKSASYIDGMIVQDSMGIGVKNRILLVIDAWAWNGGLLEHMEVEDAGEITSSRVREVAKGDGFAVINGKKYLLLSSQNQKEKKGDEELNVNIDRSKFDYIADIYGEKDREGKYAIYRLNGIPKQYLELEQEEDKNLSIGEISEYTLDENYNLYQKEIPLFVEQKGQNNKKKIPMNIFYEDSIFQIYNTSYLVQFYSDDDGVTWKKDKIISSMVKGNHIGAFLSAPGRGHQIQTGRYKGRILFPVYYKEKHKLITKVIYSDDGGKEWQSGNPVLAEQALSEAAVAELSEEKLIMFIRSTGEYGKIISVTSDNGGKDWKEMQSAFGDKEEGINCQLSAIRYSHLLPSKKDGKNYPAILLSSANQKSRKDGRLWIGLIKDEKIDWEYQYSVTEKDKHYAYSCLTELENGKVGLLYETSSTESWADGLKAIYYREIEKEELYYIS